MAVVKCLTEFDDTGVVFFQNSSDIDTSSRKPHEDFFGATAVRGCGSAISIHQRARVCAGVRARERSHAGAGALVRVRTHMRAREAACRA